MEDFSTIMHSNVHITLTLKKKKKKKKTSQTKCESFKRHRVAKTYHYTEIRGAELYGSVSSVLVCHVT